MAELDPLYLLFAAPGLLLAVYAAWRARRDLRLYARVAASSGLSGAAAAARMLASQRVYRVRIAATTGLLSDHYQPRHNVLHLSEDVYYGRSLSAIGIACHEAGHALHKHLDHWPLAVRAALLPAIIIGASLGWLVLGAGLALQSLSLVYFGIGTLSIAVLLTLVTLPLEWDASVRARALMVATGIIAPRERVHADKVLRAAVLMSLGSVVAAILNLLYYVVRVGLFGRIED